MTGGMSGNYIAYKSTELVSYDRATGHLEVTPATNLTIAMLGHCITRLNSTHVFLGGGNTNKAYLFDERKEVFTELPHLKKKRMRAACSVVQYEDGDDINGTVIMMVGGSSNFDETTYSTTEIIEIPSFSNWKFGPRIDIDSGWSNGGYATYTEVMNRNLFVLISGSGLNHVQHEYMYWYDEKRKTFSHLPKPLVYGRDYPSIAVIPSGEIDCNKTDILETLL